MDDIELETRSMVDEGAELKHGVTCLRSRPIENSLFIATSSRFANAALKAWWGVLYKQMAN